MLSLPMGHRGEERKKYGVKQRAYQKPPFGCMGFQQLPGLRGGGRSHLLCPLQVQCRKGRDLRGGPRSG